MCAYSYERGLVMYPSQVKGQSVFLYWRLVWTFILSAALSQKCIWCITNGLWE